MTARIPLTKRWGWDSNSPSTVASYVSIFETLWKQSGMYEESQNQLLSSAEEELHRMKQYLNEALKEVASFKKDYTKYIPTTSRVDGFGG